MRNKLGSILGISGGWDTLDKKEGYLLTVFTDCANREEESADRSRDGGSQVETLNQVG